MKRAVVLIVLSIGLYAGTCIPRAEIEVKGLEPLEKTAKELSNGLKGIDVLKLGQLLDENASLRSSLEEIRDRLASIGPGATVLVGPNNKVRLEVVGYGGSFYLDGWLDDRENEKFADNVAYRDGEFTLSIPDDLFSSRVESVVAQQYQQYAGNPTPSVKNAVSGFSCLGNGGFGIINLPNNRGLAGSMQVLWGGREAIDKSIVEHVQSAFGDFIRKPGVVPSADKQPDNIGLHLLRPGRHTVTLAIRPVAPNSHGKWFVDYRALVLSAGEEKDYFHTGRIDNDSEPDWQANGEVRRHFSFWVEVAE